MQAAVLFSDISGFTQLTNRLLKERGDEGAEVLTSIINRYFEDLISIITQHAGDVIKFAGDAVLSVWSSNASNENIQTLTHRAVACALEQLDKLHNWDTKVGVKLQLHLGLGAGAVRGVDLGNSMRREYVVAGEALRQLSEAEQQASSGQLVVSPEAWDMVSPVCSADTLPKHKDFGPGFKVVTKCTTTLRKPPHWRVLLQEQVLSQEEVPKEALDALYLYVPGPLRSHLVSGKVMQASQFREVTMMFIKIGGLHYKHDTFVERFQRVVYMILGAVYLYAGSLSRVSIDDKGTCIKVTFGLPPLHHNDDPARAIKCGLVIRDQVRPMRLKASIGITTGKVFIGYVGGTSRGEYTEYGVMVNMAARFMSKAVNEVLVNHTTHEKALQTDAIDFDQLAAVPMKGMDEPQVLYRAVGVVDSNYYEQEDDGRAKERQRHKRGRMIGRAPLVADCTAHLEEYAESGRGFVMLVHGESGVGKSRLLEEVVSELAPAAGITTVETRATSTDSADQLYVWRSVFRTLPRILGLVKSDAAATSATRTTRSRRSSGCASSTATGCT